MWWVVYTMLGENLLGVEARDDLYECVATRSSMAQIWMDGGKEFYMLCILMV